MTRRAAHDPAAFRYGVITLIMLVVGIGAALIGHVPFRHGYEIRATFGTAAGGLRSGSPVRIAGVNVGKVTHVGRGPGGTALATLRITDAGRPIHRDATMRLRPRLFLGGNYFVDVHPGTPSSPELEAGGTVPIAQTAVAVEPDEVYSPLDADGRRGLQSIVRTTGGALSDGGARAVNRSLRSWPGALDGIAVSMRAARGRRPGDLSGFVASQARISRAFAIRDRRLAGLVEGFAGTAGALADRREALQSTLRRLDRLLRTSPPALREIRAALAPVRKLAGALRPALRAAPSTMDLAVPFLDRARPLVAPDALAALAADARPVVRDLDRLVPRAATLLGLAAPIARCVRDNIVPTLDSVVPDGPMTVDQPAWQELLHAFVGINASTGSFDGNGPGIRFLLGVGDNAIRTNTDVAGPVTQMLTKDRLLGTSPYYPADKAPPYRPDVPCESQQLPVLASRPAPPLPVQRRLRPGRGAVPSLADALATVRKMRTLLSQAPPAKRGR
ncbi:MlaD family protein [Paraconexibacter antarcticus]|uniref:MlaD family protein n=1 Tax=Paraconexibacter antarcticus TaxID=2949664 RepID=A0ABY5E050_9ACTN|nr:MlaD family protein [Paraconexibacter antarcticus]UTI66189.1 MlaD family protein [Paraconexibacter antarcticus]